MAFLGIKIPENFGKSLNKIKVPGKKEKIQDYHITLLCFENNLPIDNIAKSLKSAYKIIKNIKPFKIKIKKIHNFPKRDNNPVPIIAEVESEDLHNLRKKIAKEFDKNKIPFSKVFKDFNPHITLAYAEEEIKPIKIDTLTIPIDELTLWGGDDGTDRVVINFPLAYKNKYSALLYNSYLFEKLAEEEVKESQTFINQYNEALDNVAVLLRSNYYKTLYQFLDIPAYDNYLAKQPNDIMLIAEELMGLINDYLITDGIKVFHNLKIGLESFISGNKILSKFKEILLNDLENVLNNNYGILNILSDIIKSEELFSKIEIENIFKKTINYFNKNDKVENTYTEALELLLNSKYLNKNLILRLLRQHNPYAFGEEYKESPKNNQYTVNDILVIINKMNNQNGIPYSEFKNIIINSTPAAKNTLRRMMWMTWFSTNQNYDDIIDFMLDETMQPIDAESRPIKIEDNWKIEQAKNIGIGYGQKWRQLFNDYEIIPFPDTFKIPDEVTKVKAMAEKLWNKYSTNNANEALNEALEYRRAYNNFVDGHSMSSQVRAFKDLAKFKKLLYANQNDLEKCMQVAVEIVEIYIGMQSDSGIEYILDAKNFIQTIKDTGLSYQFFPPIKNYILHLANDDKNWWFLGALKLILLCQNLLFDSEDMHNILNKTLEEFKNNDANGIDNESKTVQKLNLLATSPFLNKNVIHRIMRSINPESIVAKYTKEDHNNFFNKDKYNVDDIYFLCTKPCTYKNFKHVVEHATDAAKRILQSIIWYCLDVDAPSPDDAAFVLDETLQPINYEGIPVHIPDTKYIERLTLHSNDDLYAQWMQYFTDFKISPMKDTFR